MEYTICKRSIMECIGGRHRMEKRRMLLYLLVSIVFVSGCAESESRSAVDEYAGVSDTAESKEEILFETERMAMPDQMLMEAVSNRFSYEGNHYQWEDMQITIPKAWEEKYVLKEEENGISFYHKASYEKEEGTGYLCSIYRSDEYINFGIGETLAAYTDDGRLYYIMQPTDMAGYMEDAEILAEYNEMLQYVDWIAEGIQIKSEQVHYDASQYQIPVSSILPLEAQHVENLTGNQLWIARNEIYARHGKVFLNEYLASYFNTCSWYEAKEGKTEVGERELNEVEITNLKLLVEAEETYAKEHPYPKQYQTGETAEISLYRSRPDKQHICYEVINKENGTNACILTIDENSFDLEDYVVITAPAEDVFYITDIAYYDDFLEIAVLDYGLEDDPATCFFQYDGQLRYLGKVQGFPFGDYGTNDFDGFTGQNSVIGTVQIDFVTQAFVYQYYWYNSNEHTLEQLENVWSGYTRYNPHELYTDIPVYDKPDENALLLTLQKGEQVYFMKTDRKEWIFIRSSGGTEGYIHIKNDRILDLDLPVEEVFSDL